MAENMIKFLRGNVASLPQTATAGAVYFTKDEGLYLGLEDGSYHRYGDFITVANVASLPEAGAHETCMYYCESENILAKWDGSIWVQINKQKTLAELGGVAKSVYDTKMAALEKADTDNSTAIGNLSTYVGTIPESYTETDVIAYVNKKAEETLTAAQGGSSETAASVKQQLDNYKDANDTRVKAAEDAIDAIEADYLKAEDKQELQNKIDAKTTMAEVEAKNYATKTEAQGYADAKDGAIAAAQSKADQAYTLADGKANMEQVNAAIASAGHAVKSDVDKAISDMDAAYKLADSNLETKLQDNIDKKVEQTAYDTKVAALVAEDERIAGLVSDMDTAYKAADEAQIGRIATLESQITGLTGAMHFKGVKDAIPTEVEGNYANGDVIVVGEKEYVFNDGSFVEFGDVSAEGERIGALETVVGKAAEGENAATGLVKAVADNTAAIAAEQLRAETKEAELAQADVDNLAAAKKYTDDEIAELNIGQYAKQADLDTHTNNADIHITAAERTAWNAAEKNAKDYADGLDSLMNARVEALEAIDHEHSHFDVLEGITSEKVAAWDGAQAGAETTAAAALSAAKTELEGKISAAETAAKGHANTEVGKVQADLDAYKESNQGALNLKANTADVYAKTETYTKDEVNAAITAATTWGEF